MSEHFEERLSVGLRKSSKGWRGHCNICQEFDREWHADIAAAWPWKLVHQRSHLLQDEKNQRGEEARAARG